MSKTVAGIGINNAKDYTKKERVLWKNMLFRVRDHQAYADCSVSGRWEFLENFLEDIRKFPNYSEWLKNPNEWQLDKDTIVKGNKVYGAQYCCFLKKEENNCYANKPLNREYNERTYQCRSYRATHTDGTVVTFNNQKEFARTYGCDFRNVSRSIKKGGRTKGWSIKEILE